MGGGGGLEGAAERNLQAWSPAAASPYLSQRQLLGSPSLWSHLLPTPESPAFPLPPSLPAPLPLFFMPRSLSPRLLSSY